MFENRGKGKRRESRQKKTSSLSLTPEKITQITILPLLFTVGFEDSTVAASCLQIEGVGGAFTLLSLSSLSSTFEILD
jgi:hypothetical protein